MFGGSIYIMKQNQKGNFDINNSSPYKSSLTREQYLFYEMRTTAKLMTQGISDENIVNQIISDNLFQYPTEKSLKRMAKVCLSRLQLINDNTLVEAIATKPADIAKQICLYAMMKHSRLVWDFMLTVIAEKYRLQDYSFGKADLNTFFMRLQEQDNSVALWSTSTITKINQVLTKILVETDYLDSTKAEKINPVLLSSVLENAIRNNNDNIVLTAFNYFD